MRELFSVYPDAEALSLAAAEHVAHRAKERISTRGRYLIALAGGSTPAPVYRLLADRFREEIDWSRVHVFVGDERFVPEDHPESNFGMIRELLLSRVPAPVENLHPVDTSGPDPQTAAQRYESVLALVLGGNGLDTVMLGVGPDGHVASLFPPAAPDVDDRLVRAALAPPEYRTRERVTLTYGAIDAADEVVLLVAGAAKTQVVAAARSGSEAGARLPVARVSPRREKRWFVDREAGALAGG